MATSVIRDINRDRRFRELFIYPDKKLDSQTVIGNILFITRLAKLQTVCDLQAQAPGTCNLQVPGYLQCTQACVLLMSRMNQQNAPIAIISGPQALV